MLLEGAEEGNSHTKDRGSQVSWTYMEVYGSVPACLACPLLGSILSHHAGAAARLPCTHGVFSENGLCRKTCR